MATDSEALLLQFGVQLRDLQRQMDRAVGVVSDGGAKMVLRSKEAMQQIEKTYGSVDARGFTASLEKMAETQDRLAVAQAEGNKAEAKALREQLVLQQAVQRAGAAQLETQLAIAKAAGSKAQIEQLTEALALQSQMQRLQGAGLTGSRAFHEAEASVTALAAAERAAEGVNVGKALDQVFDRSRLAVLEEGSAKIPVFGAAIEALGPVGIAAAAGLAAVGIAAEETRKAMEWADDLDRTAKQLGTTTTSLQKFDYASVATSIGVQQGREAMAQFNAELGKFESHTGDTRLKKWADAIKLSRDEVNATRDPIEKLSLVMEQIAKLPDAQSRGAAAKAFGLDGLMPLINEGSEGIEKFIGKMEEARANGSIVDPREIAKAAELNDKVEELSYRIGIDFKKAFIDAAPAIETVATFIERCAHALSDFAGEIPDAVRGIESLIDKLPHVPNVNLSGPLKDAAGQAIKNATLGVIPGAREVVGLGGAARDAFSSVVEEGRAARLGDKIGAMLAAGKNGLSVVNLTGSDFDPALKRQGAGKQLSFDQPKSNPTGEFDKAAADAYQSGLKALAQAQLALTGDLQERAQAERDAIDADLSKKLVDLAAEEAKIRAAANDTNEKAQLALLEKAKADEASAAQARKDLVDRQLAFAVEDRAIEIYKANVDAQLAVLQAQSAMATTAKERAALELRILALRQQEERDLYDAQIDRRTHTTTNPGGDLSPDQAARLKTDYRTTQDAQAEAQQRQINLSANPIAAYLASLRDVNNVMQQDGVEAARDLSQALAQAAMGAKNSGQMILGVFRNLAAKLLEQAIERDVAGPLLHLIPGFASGTDFAPGGVALVGENGPELVNLPRGSGVSTAGQTLAALTRMSAPRASGPLVLQTLHFHAEGAVVTEDLLAQANAHANQAAAQAGQWARSAARQDSKHANYRGNLNS